MVSDTRSGRKIRDGADKQSLKKNSPGNASTSGARRSGGETPMSKQTVPSPQSTRKSKRLEKEAPPLTPPVKRKSERLGKYNTPSPLRKSDRGKKDTSCSSPSSRTGKGIKLSELKRKKEKSLNQVTMESEKVEETENVDTGMKRKNMNGRSFRTLFKKQCIKEPMPDVDGELDGPDKLSHVCSGNSRETFNRSEKLPTNCFSTENMNYLTSESSTCLAGSRDGSGSPESIEKHMHSNEVTASPSVNHYNFVGTCVQCYKNKRISYDSLEEELCSCDCRGDVNLECLSTCKDKADHGATVIAKSAEKHDCRNLLMEPCADCQMDGHENVCAVCNKDGELLCCVGRGCKRCYHLYCLDTPLADILPGVWHCPHCVKKKLLFGVHSVSEGVESIWDVREVVVSDAKGVRQRQYLVKYHGLAHIHNHWVPEKQLLLESPSLLSNFNGKDEIVRWNPKWTVPHRLLRRRPIQDKIFIAASAVITVCNYEWLVKWQGLSYDHATWELDTAEFLSSEFGQSLRIDYEVRCEKAKEEVNKVVKGPTFKITELPGGRTPGTDSFILGNVNKLRECWFKSQNAVVFDNQERAMTVISFIQSVLENSWPFLIVTARSSLSQWEAEFAWLAPSVAVVVYDGNRDNRKGIRASEFYDESGHLLLQVLLCSPEAVSEDVDILRSIRWEAIVVDGYPHHGLSNDLEQIKMLTTSLRLVMVSCQIQETTCEYLKLLAVLESDGDIEKLRGLKSEANGSLCKLKDRLSRFIAYGSTLQVSKFLEYWVPVQLSNFQLEQYCSTLLSNSIALGSCSRSDPVGALRDTLLSVQKCCDHPYLLDTSVQAQLIHELRPAAEILDIGIKASGKLELLDMMLTESKAQGLQVLVLFQSIFGSGGASTGDILDDFLRQKFGPNTYERVDAGVIHSKKQAAANRFNKKENGQFVFLLENRACSTAIKSLSLDIIIIFHSDWNPENDIRALQKISIDSKVERIKIFRLYSSFTVEERVLVLAKKNFNLESNLQNLSRATSDSLLWWGASYLFSKLDEYHADRTSTSAYNFSSGELLFSEVIKEFQAILSGSSEYSDLNPVISKVKLGVGSYSTNIPMLGEGKVRLKEREEANVFWRNLLDGRNPQWKHLGGGPSPRNRKRVQYFGGSPSKGEADNGDALKKRKKVVNGNRDQVELGVSQGTQVTGSKEGSLRACDQSQPSQRDKNTSNNNPNCISGYSSFDAEGLAGASEERIISSEKLKSFPSSLKGEMTRLCQIHKFSEDVTRTAQNFLEYVIKNHHVNSDSPAIVQAFQISLCWTAASISKHKVDKKDSLMLVKQLLNYQCTEEQVSSVYSKMRSLKRMYLLCSGNTVDLGRECLLATVDINKEPHAGSHISSFNQQNEKTVDSPANEEHDEGQISLQQNLVPNDKATASEPDSQIKKIQKKCLKRMNKLLMKQEEEVQKFHRTWDEKRASLESQYKLELAVIRAIHVQGSARLEKLKELDANNAKRMQEHNLLKDMQLKNLEADHLASRNEERQKADHWLAKAKAYYNAPKSVGAPHSLGSQSENNVEGSQLSTHNDVAAPIEFENAPAEASGCNTPVDIETNTVNSQSEGRVTSSARSSLAEVANEIQSEPLNEEVPIEEPQTDPEELRSVEISNESDKEYSKGNLANPLVNQRDEPDEAASGELPSSEQNVALSEQVPQDHQYSVSSEMQDRDAPLAENQRCDFQIEVAPMERIDTADAALVEAPVAEDTLNAVQPNNEAPLTETQLLHVAVDVSISCSTSPAVEVENQNHDERSSSQNAECRVTVEHSQESIGRSGENLELNHNHLSRGPVGGVANGPNVDLSASYRNNMVVSQAVVSTVELPNQAMQQGIDGGVLLGRNYPAAQFTHQSTLWNLTPSVYPDPLQSDVERIRKETEHLEKIHQNMVSQIKSDCEKEIQEVIAQIRKKYDMKLQDAEAGFRLKRNELDRNQTKVLMNKILAEAFRSKCLDLRPSGLYGMQQGGPSGVMQQVHQKLSMPPSLSLSPGALQTIQPQPQPQPQAVVRPSPVGNQSVAAVASPPVQVIQQTPAIVSGPSTRPPLISAITPAASNPSRPVGDIRAMAPHLQSFRPAASPPSFQPRPPSQPVQPPPPSPPPSNNCVSERRPWLQGGTPGPNNNPTMSSVELVMEMDRQASTRASSPLPDICTTFCSLEQSDLEKLGNVQQGSGSQVQTPSAVQQGSDSQVQTPSAVATDAVVCLSDGD